MQSSEREPLLQNNSTSKILTSLEKPVVNLTMNEELPDDNGLKTGQENEAAEVTLHTETCQAFPQVTGSSTTSFSAEVIQISFQQVLCSGKLLKFFASIFGLWPMKRRLQLAVFTTFLAIDIFGFVYIVHQSYYYIYYLHKNATYSYMYLSYVWEFLLPVSYVLSYLLMFHYTIVSSRKRHVFSLPSACLKTSNLERLLLNIQFIILCCSLTTYFFVSNSHFCTDCTILVQFSRIALYIFSVGTFLTCLVFATLTCALHKSASECHIIICGLNEGSLEDVINIHQDLCDCVFATCKALQPWFVTHWLLLGAESVITILLCVYEGFSHNPYLSFPITLVPYLFLLPSLYAARVTRRCQSIISEINNSRPRDWGDAHPFRKRKILNHFVLYANGVSCGYRVFGVNFGDTLGWLSFMFSIVALGFKLFYHQF